jgi:isocitrate lyase
VPTLVIARTDADSATLLTSDVDEADRRVITGERSPEGFFFVSSGLEPAIARGLAYAPYCDVIWCETSHPDLGEARTFAEAIHREYPGKLLAYNCSPSFNWRRHLDDATIAAFQRELGAMGYKFQFITLAGFHSINTVTFELAPPPRPGMTATPRSEPRVPSSGRRLRAIKRRLVGASPRASHGDPRAVPRSR